MKCSTVQYSAAQVGIAEEQKQLLGCAYENPHTGRISYFVSKTMILGESGAVHSFTRLIKPVVKQARLLGWKGVVYVDDFEHAGATEADCIRSREILKDVARLAGWLFSEAKEQEPSRCFRFLGYNLNTQTMRFEVPEDKLVKALTRVNLLLRAGQTHRRITNRLLAKAVGLLCSFHRAYPGFSRLMLRSCYATIEARGETWWSWDQSIRLTTEARDELSWWRS